MFRQGYACEKEGLGPLVRYEDDAQRAYYQEQKGATYDHRAQRHDESEPPPPYAHVITQVRHPFVMRLHYSFQSKGKLYLIMDFLRGGDLFYHLSREKRFQEDRARFYAAEVVLALECLHKLGFIYR